MTEEEVSAVLAEVLEVGELGVNDNFFDFGGNSILALTLIARLKEMTGKEIPFIDVIYTPTARGLAEVLERAGA